MINRRMLDRHGFISSMSGKGNCYDNATVETLLKTIKSELVWRTAFQSRRQAEYAIARYIDGFYNPVRRHSALGYKSPITFDRHRRSDREPGASPHAPGS
jgi:putative transposase